MYYPPVRETTNNMNNKRRLTVYGSSMLSIEPNVAEIHIGVVTQDIELETAQQQNARTIQNIIESLINIGIPQKDIQTIDYNIYPQYDFVDGNQQFRGYQVSHMLSITIENFEQTGTVIDTAVRNGANRVSNIKFTVKNRSFYYQQALKLALEDASTKAQTMAQAMRFHLDPTPYRILEQTSNPSPTPYKMLSNSEMVGGVSTPIEPGRLNIEAKVEVQFHYYV